MNELAQSDVAKEAPPGWDYNPSAWSQRLPIVGLAVVAFAAAAHLAAYQLRLVAEPWEPFFGGGSKVILDSWVSTLLPVSDATLGALSYVLDAIAGIVGGTRRYKTMPWIVVLFGILVGPLGAVSVGLVILQPLLFDAWCTLCLLTALLSVLMIGPAMDEVLASLQYLKRRHAEGESWWRAFWGLPTRAGADAGTFGMQHRTR
jgi:uncharacterized membrane protein